MNQHAAVGKFSHVKPGDTDYKGGGLRDFFLYRDLGIADATSGQRQRLIPPGMTWHHLQGVGVMPRSR
jgi:hypothetical protein